MKPAHRPITDATVITATSRLATWASSWLSTPSSSSALSRRMMPVVTQTTAWSGDRPVANALGRSVWAIATRGFGMSARATRRSTMPCNSGASSGVTTLAFIAVSASRSEKYHWAQARPTTTMMPKKKLVYAIRIAPNANHSTTKSTDTRPMRAVSPRSPRKRVFAIRYHLSSKSTNDEPPVFRLAAGLEGIRNESLVTKQSDDLVHLGVGRRQDQIGVDQRVFGKGFAPVAYGVEQSGQRRLESPLILAVHRRFDRGIKLIERREVSVVDLELTLAEDPDDHD